MKRKKVLGIMLAAILLCGNGLYSMITNPAPVLADDATSQAQSISDLPSKENVVPDKTWTITFNAALNPTLTAQELSEYVTVTDSAGNSLNLTIKDGNDPQSLLVLPPANGYQLAGSYNLYVKQGLKFEENPPLQNTYRMKFTITSDIPGKLLQRPAAGRPQIAAGWDTAYYLDSSGHVWAWGGYGEISSGLLDSTAPSKLNPVDSLVPVQISGLSDVVSIAAGNNSAYALDSSGNVWAWGSNLSGQLGNGTTNNSSTPVKIENISNIVAIAAKGVTNYALDCYGHVWSWGSNHYGQLGNGMAGGNDVSTVPVQVSKLANIISIAAGEVTGYALDSSGHVWAWGDGKYGELNGTGSDANGPVQVSNLPEIMALDGGSGGCYALDNYGNVWVWGENIDGSLGIGTTNNIFTGPVKASSLSNITALAAGGDTQYALDASGHVWSWGHNYGFQLGNSTVKNSTGIPVQVSDLKNIVSIAGGFATGYALDSSGHVWAWGEGDYGQFGNGKSESSVTPVQVSNLPPSK